MKRGDNIFVVNWHAGVGQITEARITRIDAFYLWCGIGIRVPLAERGLGWVPAWREVEVEAFRVACALGGIT